jgi:hypothetical protein
MIPIEKAHELAMKFDKYGETDNAKQCALIAVDEIINSVVITDLKTAQNQFNYWEEVKTEIEKL